MESRELLSRIREPAFSKPRIIKDRAEIDRIMNNSEAILILDIPNGFERDIHREGTTVQVLVDGSQSTAAYLSSAYLGKIINDFSLEKTIEENYRKGLRLEVPVELRSRILFNPDARDDIYEGLIEFFMMITLVGMILPAAMLIREREYGTIEQILISPLSIGRLIILKILASMLFLISVIAASYLLVLKLWLGLPLKGGITDFLVVTLIFLISTTGLAFIIASVARRFSQIGMLTIVIFAPMLLLSGGWVPPEALPDWLRAATRVSPLKQFMDIGVSILIRGATMDMLSLKLAKLFIIGAALIGTGGLLYKRKVLK